MRSEIVDEFTSLLSEGMDETDVSSEHKIELERFDRIKELLIYMMRDVIGADDRVEAPTCVAVISNALRRKSDEGWRVLSEMIDDESDDRHAPKRDVFNCIV